MGRQRILALVALVAGCGGGQAERPLEPPPAPKVEAASDADIRQLLADLSAYNVCEVMQGDFLAIHDQGAPPGPEHDSTPIIGRLWVEECTTRQHRDRFTLELGGRGWQWVDRRSRAAGATFRVSQYVPIAARMRMTGRVDLHYDRGRRIVSAWFSPVTPVDAAVRPIGDVDVEAEGLWSGVVSGIATLVGQSPESRADTQLRRVGSDRFEANIRAGFTVTYDLCRAQLAITPQRLREGEVPERPAPARDRAWDDNYRVTLYPTGFDADGPYSAESGPVNVEVQVESGPGVEAQFVCTTEMQELVTAFADGRALPEVESHGAGAVDASSSRTIRSEEPDCDLDVVFRPAAGASEPTTFTYIVWSEGADQQPMVACDE